MPYEYLPDIAIADVAFRAWSDTLEGLFTSAAEATMNVMVGDLDTISRQVLRQIAVSDGELDMLLFQLLQELIFHKDAEKLLLRIDKIEVRRQSEGYELTAEASGEELDPMRHDLVVDVKAVTLHRFRVDRTPGGWEAEVILDI
jgi:SHS2 domain-containing protein